MKAKALRDARKPPRRREKLCERCKEIAPAVGYRREKERKRVQCKKGVRGLDEGNVPSREKEGCKDGNSSLSGFSMLVVHYRPPLSYRSFLSF